MFVSLTGMLVSPVAAQTPEAADPDVARCAEVLSLRLLARGLDGRKVVEVAADPVNASIDRWEARFSARNATKVATLIRVPLLATYFEADKPPAKVELEAQCGYTSGKLLATDIVVTKK